MDKETEKREERDGLVVLTPEEYETEVEDTLTQDVTPQDWAETMEALATPGKRLAVPRTKDFSRKQVVEAFATAFELVGGIPRLALWAHHNESDFYKLYARLLPSQASSALGESNELIIKHVLPRGPLDE